MYPSPAWAAGCGRIPNYRLGFFFHSHSYGVQQDFAVTAAAAVLQIVHPGLEVFIVRFDPRDGMPQRVVATMDQRFMLVDVKHNELLEIFAEVHELVIGDHVLLRTKNTR